MASSSSLPVEDSQKKYVTMRPYFRVTDWDAVLPIMQQMHDEITRTTSDQPSALYHDWTRSNDQLSMRTTFDNAENLQKMLENIKPLLDIMLSTAAVLDRFEFHGPEAELQKIKQADNDLDAEYYDSHTGFQTGYFSQTNDKVSQGAFSHTMCTYNPQFTIHNWNAVQPIMEQFMELTSNETNCLYFGWTKDKANKLYWHADFKNGEALKNHFEQVYPLLNAMTQVYPMDNEQLPAAALDRIEVHGPLLELEKIEEGSKFDTLPLEYYVTDNRVQRIIQNLEFNPSGSSFSNQPFINTV